MSIYFKNTPVQEPFAWECIGNCWEQDQMVRHKGYPHYHYLQPQSGCGRMEIEGREFLLGEGDGILMAPFLPHSYGPVNGGWQTRFATFTGTLESSIGNLLGNRKMIPIHGEQGERTGKLIDRMIEQYETFPAERNELSVLCYRLLLMFMQDPALKDVTAEPLYIRYVEPVLKKMKANFAKELTVGQLSGEVYVSPQYLSRLFYRFLGCSCYDYLMTIRMNKGKEYLMTCPGMAIQEIARRVGFQDASHFTAMFRKKTGMTPGQFRRTAVCTTDVTKQPLISDSADAHVNGA